MEIGKWGECSVCREENEHKVQDKAMEHPRGENELSNRGKDCQLYEESLVESVCLDSKVE